MKLFLQRPFALALTAGALLFSAPLANGHGGTYRGPGDVVPPGGSGGGKGGNNGTPTTGGLGSPTGPTTGNPIPGQPGTGGPGNPSNATGGTGGISQPTLTDWSFWWEFNKDPYIGLKRSLGRGMTRTGSAEWFMGQGEVGQGRKSLQPTRDDVENVIVPALLRALEDETNNDILTGALMALGKIGDELGEDGVSHFAGVISRFLDDQNQEISETAALALGMLADQPSVQTLTELYRDTTEGRKLVGRGEVPIRTRAFAAYGLGMCGAAIADEASKQAILESLRDVLVSERSSTRDIHVASVIAMGLVPLDKLNSGADGDPDALDSRERQLTFLMELLESDAHGFVRAHVPTAVARLCADVENDATFDTRREAIAKVLIERVRKERDTDQVLQSCIIALGMLGDADPRGVDAEIRKTLIGVAEHITDKQARYYAAIALAEASSRQGSEDMSAGLAEGKGYILARLARGNSAVRTWNALATGVMGNALETPPAELVDALKLAARDERTERIGAFAVGAGMLGAQELTPILIEKLDTFASDTARGYLCIGLGMLGATEAQDRIRTLVEESTYRPELLKSAAIGLGLLQDEDAVGHLVDALERSSSIASQAALATALGFIGDRNAIPALIELLENEEMTPKGRAFAAVALGLVGDQSDLPWNSAIARNINYTANTLTLNDNSRGTGVLNIL